jgi:outer membrane protein assembly factor BamB
VRLKADGGGVAAEQVYFTRGLPNGLGGAVVLGDHLYGTDIATGVFVAIEFATGKMKWKSDTVGRVSIAAAEGLLYLHGLEGDVALIEANPEAYREKGRFTPPVQPKHLQKEANRPYPEQAYAHPVIANGRLYIRDLGTLWAYDIKDGR